MKYPRNYSLLSLLPSLLLLLPLLAACNGDVFVEKIEMPLTEATFHGDGDTLSIRFKTDKWALNYAGTKTNTFEGTYYDLDDSHSVSRHLCYLEKPGKVIVDNAGRELTFIRPNKRELQVLIGENTSKEAYDFYITISNNYLQLETIQFRQQPGSGYVIDDISYAYQVGSYHTKLKEQFYLIIPYAVSKPEEETFNLNKQHQRNILFSCDETINLVPAADGEEYTIPLPEYDSKHGSVITGTDRAPYIQYGNDLVDAGDIEPPFLYTATLKDCTNYIFRRVKYQVYTAPYRLYLRNVKTGKRRFVEGTLKCEDPIGTVEGWVEYEE